MTYLLTKSPARGEVLLRWLPDADPAEVERGRTIARALKARTIRDPEGQSMTNYAAERWRLLFEAGYHARLFTLHGGVRIWKMTKGDRYLTMLQAVRKIRNNQPEVF